MAKTTEIILRDGKAFRRVIGEEYLGWTNDLIEEYCTTNNPQDSKLYAVGLGEKAMLALSRLKVFVVGEIDGFDFSAHFSPVRVNDEEVFFIPTRDGGVHMTLPWRPPSDAICVVGYAFDLKKKYMDAAFIYLLPREQPDEEVKFQRLVHVPALTNIWTTGLICLGNSKPVLYEFPLWEFREDFVHRMSTIPWNNDLFPSGSLNLVNNRWNAKGEKEDYSLANCPRVEHPDGAIIEVVERYYYRDFL